MKEYNIDAADAGIRLDRWFHRHYPAVSFGEIAKWARKGEIRVNKKRVKTSDRLNVGDVLRVPPQAASYEGGEGKTHSVPQKTVDDIAAAVIFEDDEIIVINKPAGMASQGGSGIRFGLDSVMRAYTQSDAAAPVHRLDRDTTGLLVFAKNPTAAAKWGEAFRRKEAQKTYVALICGSLPHEEGYISDFLAKRRMSSGERMVSLQEKTDDAKPARTRYSVIDKLAKEISLVSLEPLTGRTHQLRVHMAAEGCPIVGDYKYGYDENFRLYPQAKTMFLHAQSLQAGGKSFEAPLPKAFADGLKSLGLQGKT